jgi:hypothetical protein
MTTSTTMTSGTISSRFLTDIQTQKQNLETAMFSIKNSGTTTMSSTIAVGLVTFMQGYITFLQANSQYTSLASLSSVTSINQSSSVSSIATALQQVIMSVYQIEGQEITRVVKDNPTYAYQGASQLYQATYQLSIANASNMSSWNLSSTSSLSATTQNANTLQFYGLYKLQCAYAGASEIYTYLKAFVTEYSLTSQIDSLYLAMQNYPDGYSGGANNGPAAVTALLNGEMQCVNWLASFASSDSSNPIATANVLGGKAISPMIYLVIAGGVASVAGLGWFLLNR